VEAYPPLPSVFRTLDPDQEAALRRLRAAFGFVEVLAVVDHEADQERGDNEAVED
jgi:hypothetical protein